MIPQSPEGGRTIFVKGPCKCLKKEINRDERGDIHLDLEIGDFVAVDVPLDNARRTAELSIHTSKHTCADERESLIANRAVGIGIDGRQVDLVALGANKIEDDIAIDAPHALGDQVEVKFVGAGTPVIVSLPMPPISVSFPDPPSIVSWPPSPLSTLAPVLPVRR